MKTTTKNKNQSHKSIRSVLDKHQKWCKNYAFICKDSRFAQHIEDISLLEKEDVRKLQSIERMCLSGACAKVYGKDTREFSRKINKLAKAITEVSKRTGKFNAEEHDEPLDVVVQFNDDSNTTFKDIKLVLNKAKV